MTRSEAIAVASTILIPFAIGIVYFRKFSRQYRIFVFFIIDGVISEIVLMTSARIWHTSLPYVHFGTLVEVAILSQFFSSQLKEKTEKRIFLYGLLGVVAFGLVYASIGNHIMEFNSIPRAIQCIYLSIFACYVFYQMSLDPSVTDNGIYFCNGSILFYFTSNFIVFAFGQYVSSNPKWLLTMYDVHSFVNAMCNIGFAVGLWIASRSSYSAA